MMLFLSIIFYIITKATKEFEEECDLLELDKDFNLMEFLNREFECSKSSVQEDLDSICEQMQNFEEEFMRYTREPIEDLKNFNMRNNTEYATSESSYLSHCEPSKKRIKRDEEKFFENTEMDDLKLLNLEDENIVKTQIYKQNDKEFDIICNSIEENLNRTDLIEAEKEMLLLQFPYLGLKVSLHRMVETYINIIIQINSLLVNILNIYFPNSHYEEYKIESPTIYEYFNYKRRNRFLYEVCLAKKEILQANYIHAKNLFIYRYLRNNIDSLLSNQKFTLKSLNHLLRRVRRRDEKNKEPTKISIKKLLLLNIGGVLKSLKNDKHRIPNCHSLLLSLINKKNTKYQEFYLFYFYAFLRGVETIKTGALNSEKEEIIKNSSGKILEYLLHHNISAINRDVSFSALEIKNYIYEKCQYTRESLSNTKNLFLNFFYFMVDCDRNVLKTHFNIILDQTKNYRQIDFIYYGLYTELNDIYNIILLE
ncbi:hypothetical protein NGRA_0750 [Nosema granulosis]|uniref:Uncharacterized protein n=1 Tax=Nosema granulosis TaxID=83296 RepID=A0A9P6H0D1_9MICR|nr:hypothetical protein NGRA_0750 [Nosema granulosis]